MIDYLTIKKHVHGGIEDSNYAISMELAESNFLHFYNVPSLNINSAFNLMKLFFNLPLEVKKEYISEGNPNIGYVPYRKEKAIGAECHDLKEFYHVGTEMLTDNTQLWPKEIQEFKDHFSDLYGTLHEISNTIFKYIGSQYLKIGDDYINDIIYSSSPILRLIKYPKIFNSIKGVRAHEHTGVNLIGLCLASTSEGLEYITNEGIWNKAPNLTDKEVVVNIGEFSEFISPNRVKPTLHRVVNPSTDLSKERYAIVFFFQPKGDFILRNPITRQKITTKNLLKSRLKETGIL